LWVVAVLLLGCGGPSVVTVQMKAENDSSEDGTATLTQKGNDLEVKVQLGIGGDTGTQQAHIHKGTCPGLGEIVKALSPVVNGESVTSLTDTQLDEFAGGGFVVNVHSSAQASKYVSCGVIP
jgi:hypothetical protein